MIASPEGPHIAADDLGHFLKAWNGSEPKWLNPEMAVEFEIRDTPLDLALRRREAHDLSLDLVVQPSAGRRKRILVSDMDSTVIWQECIDEMAAAAGHGERVAGITARAMNGEIGFRDALRQRVSLFEGMDSDVIEKVWRERITLMPGAVELVATMREFGGYAVLVSGGFTEFAQRVASTLGFDEFHANTLETRNGRLTGKVVEPALGADAKRQVMKRVASRRNVDLAEMIAAGDGANDLGILKLAGAGVAYHAKPAVAAQCPIQVNFGDLTALLYLQGYRKSEFALP